ncbi:HAMP domain-containing protein [Heliobacterium gestii]|uniref:histidine kinase n=1 Tax=Heliomicrobium gestii TaxID=2699 RepID=A0A845LNQ8_HELGE|nr:HAMP domain-containing sensor histidine kinase [Heliomicrobium gestii]MBM7868329.1 signal transduction histidine kinase [Heliomicrobium gestii]MZP44516.1 HAMP domain-containing protein [Heliomicrobium gestii]
MKIRTQAFFFFLLISGVAAASTLLGMLILYQELLRPDDNNFEHRQVAAQIERWRERYHAEPVGSIDPLHLPLQETPTPPTPASDTNRTGRATNISRDRLIETLAFDRDFHIPSASVQLLDSNGVALTTRTTWNRSNNPAIAANDHFPDRYTMAQIMEATRTPLQVRIDRFEALFEPEQASLAAANGKTAYEAAPLSVGGETYYLLLRYEPDSASDARRHTPEERTVLLAGVPLTAGAGILAVNLVAALAFSWLLRAPLKKLAGGLENMRRGDTSYRIQSWRKDEFGDLFVVFNQLNTALGALKQREQEIAGKQRDLFAGLSHDLRTPLASIEGYAEALSDIAYREPEQARKYGGIIHAKALIMGRIVDDLFLTAKLVHPDFALQPRSADLAELTRRWTADILPDIELAGQHLDADIPEIALWASVDVSHLERAIKNVLKNAIEHNGPGIGVYVTLAAQGNTALLRIADTGMGVPAHLRERLFERFARADTARNSKNGSTGLGLAISREIIAAHGGSILLEPAPPEGGAAFLIRLPLAAPPLPVFPTA